MGNVNYVYFPRSRYDNEIQALSGMASVSGSDEDGRPTIIPTIVSDKIAALTAAQAISSALFKKERTGKGRPRTNRNAGCTSVVPLAGSLCSPDDTCASSLCSPDDDGA